MPNHRLIVARGFKLAGWGLGAPAFLAALTLGAGAVMGGAGSAAPTSGYLSVSSYGLTGLLSNAATGVGRALSFLNGLAAWVFGLLAALALAVALFAGLLYLVGRGLKASAGWARVLAGVIVAVLSLCSLLALSVLTGGARLVDVVVLAALVYVLWVLARRFA